MSMMIIILNIFIHTIHDTSFRLKQVVEDLFALTVVSPPKTKIRHVIDDDRKVIGVDLNTT